MKTTIVVSVLSLILTGCSRGESGLNATPSPTPPARPIEVSLEQEMDSADTLEQRLAVRELVNEYLKKTHPEWRVQGLSLTHFAEDADYYIAADIIEGSTPKIVQLKAWFFVKENGETYWKIAPIE